MSLTTAPEADARWTDWLRRAEFLVSDPPTHPMEPLALAFDVTTSLRKAVVSAGALERDRYRLDRRDATREVIGYRLQPDKDGLWILGADHHWGYARALFELEPLQHDVFAMAQQAGSDEWMLTFSRMDAAREAFRQQDYTGAVDEIEALLAAEKPSPGHVLEWRAAFLLGLMRLGFAGGDLALVDLGAAERAFATAARYTRDTLPHVAVQALTCAAFAALEVGGLDRAAGFVEAATRLHDELPETRWLEARIQAARGDIDGALSTLARVFAMDRGYILRSVAGPQPVVPADRLLPFLRLVAEDVWNHGMEKVQESLERTEFWQTHAGSGAPPPPAVARLESFVRDGQHWPLYDLLQVLTERDEIVDELLAAAADERHVEVSLDAGPEVDVEEPFVSVEPYRERVVAREATLFRKEEIAWVVRSRTVTHVRRVRRHLPLRRARYQDGAGRVLAELRMVRIAAGAFWMGSGEGEAGRGPDEQRHLVTLTTPYFLGDTAVTQRLWRLVMGGDPAFAPDLDAPVEQVSWLEAVTFCNALSALEGLAPAYEVAAHGAWWLGQGAPGYRLPTEAEWEHACRAGTTTSYAAGTTLPADAANFARRPATRPSPVRSFPANGWGLYDMHGGVWEWCFDSWRPHPEAECTDPVTDVEQEGRVARGGSWASDADGCRSAARKHFTPWHRANNLGFRIALTAPADAEG